MQIDRIVTARWPCGELQLAVALHDVGTDRTVPHQLPVLTGGAGELFVLTDRVGAELRQRLELSPAGGRTTSASREAMQAYTEGLALLTRDDPKGAAPALTRAVTIDPGFGAAWLQLSRAQQRSASRPACAPLSAPRCGDGEQQCLLRSAPRSAAARSTEEHRALSELVTRYHNDSRRAARWRRLSAVRATRRMAGCDRRRRDPNPASCDCSRFAFADGDEHLAANEYRTRALLLQNERGDRAGSRGGKSARVAYENSSNARR